MIIVPDRGKGHEIRSSNVKSRIHSLKNKIQDGSGLFHTVRGVGYKVEDDMTKM